MKNKNRKDNEGFFSLKSIKRKLGWSFGILIFLIALFVILSYNINKSIQTDAKFVREVNAPLNIMVEQVIGYDAILTGNAHAALLHSIKGDNNGVAEYKKKYDEAGIKLDKLLKVDARALINRSRRSLQDKEEIYKYLKQLDEINLKLVDLETRAFAAMEKGNNEEAYSLIVSDQYREYKQTLFELYNKWGDAEAKVSEYYRQRILSSNLKAKIINEFMGGIFILAAIIFPFLIFKTVVNPIKRLTDIAENISSGDLDVKMPDDLKKNKSEVGELARAFYKLLESSHFALKTLVESKMSKREKKARSKSN